MTNILGTGKLFVENYKVYGVDSVLQPEYDYSDALINISVDSTFDLPSLTSVIPAYYVWIKRIDYNEANLVIIPNGTDIINTYSDVTISPGDDLCLIADPANGQWIFKKGYIAYVITLSQQALLGSNYLPGSVVYFQEANAIVNAIGPFVSNGTSWSPMGESGVNTFGLIYGSGSISSPLTSVQMLPTALPNVTPIYDGSAWVYTNNFLNQYTYVSNSGNNLTGIIGDQYFPFATIDAAITAGGTLIYITTGSYSVPASGSYVASNVTLVFEPSVYFNSVSTNPVFSSNALITNFNIYGSPNFNISGPAINFSGFPTSLTDSYIELGVINSTYVGVNIEVGDSGSNYEIHIQSLNVPGPAVVLFGSGTFGFDNIVTSDSHAFQVFATAGDFVVEGNVILSGMLGTAISWVYPNANYNIYLNVNQLIELNVAPLTNGTLFIKSDSISNLTVFNPCTINASVISLGNCTLLPGSEVNLTCTTCGTIGLQSGGTSGGLMNLNIKNITETLSLNTGSTINIFNIIADSIYYLDTSTPLITSNTGKIINLSCQDITCNYFISSSNSTLNFDLTNVKNTATATLMFNISGGTFNYTGSLVNTIADDYFSLTNCVANIKCASITSNNVILATNGGCTVRYLVLSSVTTAAVCISLQNDTVIIKNAYIKGGNDAIECNSTGPLTIWDCILVSNLFSIVGPGTTPVRFYGSNAAKRSTLGISVVLGSITVNSQVS